LTGWLAWTALKEVNGTGITALFPPFPLQATSKVAAIKNTKIFRGHIAAVSLRNLIAIIAYQRSGRTGRGQQLRACALFRRVADGERAPVRTGGSARSVGFRLGDDFSRVEVVDFSNEIVRDEVAYRGLVLEESMSSSVVSEPIGVGKPSRDDQRQ
jgi:hypothetical protein